MYVKLLCYYPIVDQNVFYNVILKYLLDSKVFCWFNKPYS